MLLKHEAYDVLIIGGGFFGLNIAEYFAKQGRSVLVCEQTDACMTRASYVNQARVHNGYHYPRSILTALRSRVSFPRFVKEFAPCIKNDFEKYYAIGSILGKVNALQFKTFCDRIGAECEEAAPSIVKLFSSHYIEKVFRTNEFAFDSHILRDIMLKRVQDAGVEIAYNLRVRSVCAVPGQDLSISCFNVTYAPTVTARHVFNCTYSNINVVNRDSAIDLIPLKYEMTEMALVEPPQEIEGRAFTIMCGPFFSIMPFPSESLYSLSHVRYTPHFEWYDASGKDYVSPQRVYEGYGRQTAYPSMVSDAARYLPSVAKCNYRKSIWEVKTVLPSSEIDDSRPILFKMNYGMKGYHCVMGGKIDNIYDVIQAIEQEKEVFK